MKNRYVRRSRISEAKFRELVRYFALDLDAYKIAALTGLNRNTVNRYTRLIRERIAEVCEQDSPLMLKTEKESLDETGQTLSGGRCTVVGILERNDRIYAEIIPEASRELFSTMERERHSRESISATGHWRAYDGLVDIGTRKFIRVSRSQEPNKISRVESFWAFVKKRMLLQFQGVPESTFHLHLKECEFRFNSRDQNIYSLLLQMLRENPLE